MSFRPDQYKQDAYMMAETCRMFSSTLDPQERVYFLSSLVDELVHERDHALLTAETEQPVS